GLGVGVHDRELGQAELLEDRGRKLDPALAILPDAGLRSRARQQNADLQRATLRAREVERRARGEQSSRPRAGGEGAAAGGGGIGGGGGGAFWCPPPSPLSAPGPRFFLYFPPPPPLPPPPPPPT